ncbi:autotransporter domain-containing protein [Parvibaculum sp.]|uniref:autotransporter domain-containing protein n=1 Tax=Parvibaculum sp. TaxID=2024848 RepID=UPI002CCC4DE7|nr:autotransporter domain-containing protein [Parvibaculum sp.]HUD51678.1 autotransporter domain-containing protein [Parvibaculum sp.]
MSRSLKLRSLLTTTSMVALLAAPGVARADTSYDNPFGTTIDQLLITTTVSYVNNSGTIENNYGEPGIDIDGTTVYGHVTNSPTGVIDVENGEDGDAIGIRVYNSYINGIANQYSDDGEDYGQIIATATDEQGGSGSDSATYDAAASATGIQLHGTVNNGSIYNGGSIAAEATSEVDQSATDNSEDGADAYAQGYSTAYAAGIDVQNDNPIISGHDGPVIASYVDLYGTIDATATAESDSSASATSTYYDDADAYAYDEAYSTSYGVRLSGTSAYVGDVYNDAEITASSTAKTQSNATAYSEDDDAWAAAGWNGEYDNYYCDDYEGSIASASATGLLVDVLHVDGDITNENDISADATAKTESTALATGYDYAEAYAENDYTQATSYGIYTDALLVSGNFENSGDINVKSKASVDLSATANSNGEAYSSAYADSVSSYAEGISFDVDSLGGGFDNSADIVSAVSIAKSETTATTVGGEYSDAYATGNAYSSAAALDIEIGSIAGDFENTGELEAVAIAKGKQTATVSSDESLTAGADSDQIYAEAYGSYLSGRTLAGSFINEGTVTAKAVSVGESTATATGLDDLEAYAGNTVRAEAYGVSVVEDEIQDSVYNDGEINVRAVAKAEQTATATADLGEGDAAALAGNFFGEYGEDVSVSSEATGLYVGSEEGDIGGNILNFGAISVDAISNVDSTATATAYGTGEGLSWGLSQTYAQAYGIDVENVDVGSYDVTDAGFYPRGYFVNDASVAARASSTINQTISANADDGSAAAGSYVGNIGYYDYSEDGAPVQATGIELNDVSLLGSVLNDGSVYAQASAEANLSAQSDVDDGDETMSAALAGGQLGTEAYGIRLQDVSAYADSEEGYGYYAAFENTGTVAAVAYTNLSADADAYSDDGIAMAISGVPNTEDGFDFSQDDVYPNFAQASAAGVTLDDVYMNDDVWNDGMVLAGALAISGGTAEAEGDESALAVAGNSAEADAVGFNIINSSIDGDVYNDGVIVGAAGAYTDSTAHADAKEATARIGYVYTPSVDAYGTGLAISQYYGSTVYNGEDGVIIGLAGSVASNDADADGRSSADAYVDYEEYASASGFVSSSSYSGGLVNDGLIIAGALSMGDQTARATTTSASGVSDAYAEDYAEAYATGADFEGDLQNSGTIFAGAYTVSNADASAVGKEAHAGAQAHAGAGATAVSLRGDSEDGVEVYNSGTISSLAVAQASISTSATSDFLNPTLSTDGYADASAEAIGLDILCGTYVDEITNTEDGVISAQATATTTENGEVGYGGSAYATALRLSDVYLDGNITNDGIISATAEGDDYASAVGIDISGSTSYSGSLFNSGTIEADATGDETSATAIRLSGGSLNVIENTGDILAYTHSTGVNLFTYAPSGAIAIDATDAGQGLTIEQLDGRIVGKILLANLNSDHIEWSGGTIQGDISGTYGEDGDDVLDIFAGEDNAFTYADTIDGLDAVNLNSDWTDAVSLRLTGSINNTNRLYVGSNATLSLSTGASVNVNDLTLASTGTLSYDLASDGSNAVINTTTADLGGGTVKAVFLDVQNPTTQTYRIINWDDNDSTFGTVTSNSILQKVTALYGDDGVDLVVTKVSFGDLNNLVDDAQRLGHALDGVFKNISLDSELGQALVGLIGLSPDEYEKAMNQIAGQQLADLQTATDGQLGDLLHVIQTQLSGMRGTQQASLGMNSLGIMVADNQVTTMSDAPVAGVGGPAISGNWSAWARAFGDWASLKRDGYRPGFTSDAGGVVAGVDYKLSDNFLLGLAGGYQKTNMDFRGTGDGDITSWSLTAYGDYSFGPAYVDMLAGYSKQSYNLNRFLDVLGSNYTANSDYDGSSYAVSIETGYGFDVAANTKVTPFVGINYTHTDADSVTETGAGIWNLTYDSRSGDSVESVLGARLSYAFTTEGGTRYVPTVELGWKHEYADTQPTTNAALAGTPGSNFLITGQEAARDSAIVGASLGVQLTEEIDGSVQYNGQYSSDYSDSTASVRLRLKF